MGATVPINFEKNIIALFDFDEKFVKMKVIKKLAPVD